MQDKTIQDVRAFWEANPLFAGESDFAPGTREFFEQHGAVYLQDCFAGEMEARIFPAENNTERVLDLGCGAGFWSIELKRRGAQHVVAADLTETALSLTRERALIFGVEIETCRQNAEAMTFPDGDFSHVNCQGVIHHTPDTAACVREIARVLRPGGTAMISVYFRNAILRSWPALKYAGKILDRMGSGMKGRGRENIFATGNIDDVVRLYDGDQNPIGKAYSRRGFVEMLSPHLQVDEIFLHFFPARSLPFGVPRAIHRWLDRRIGFLIFARCRKR